jgi:hypothetical protein
VVFEFGVHYPLAIPYVSMRYYDKGRRLRRAGFDDCRQIVLQMMLRGRLTARTAVFAWVQRPCAVWSAIQVRRMGIPVDARLESETHRMTTGNVK